MVLTVVITDTMLAVLQDFVDNGKIFTGFEVTAEVRNRVGPSEIFRHGELRPLIHQEYLKVDGILDDYRRKEGVELSVSGNPQVIVYYPNGEEAENHPLALHQPSTVPDDTDSDDTDVVDSDADKKGGYTENSDGSITINVTAEGRFTFPKCLLGKINVDSTAGSYDFKSGADTFSRRPNTDGRVRIGKVGLGLGDSIKVTVNTDTKTITIEAA